MSTDMIVTTMMDALTNAQKNWDLGRKSDAYESLRVIFLWSQEELRGLELTLENTPKPILSYQKALCEQLDYWLQETIKEIIKNMANTSIKAKKLWKHGYKHAAYGDLNLVIHWSKEELRKVVGLSLEDQKTKTPDRILSQQDELQKQLNQWKKDMTSRFEKSIVSFYALHSGRAAPDLQESKNFFCF